MVVRRLVVNADDFGYSHDVNAGIVEAHTRGILTATTLMANGGAFEDAVRLAHEHPTLDVGVHLVLVGGTAVSHRLSLPETVTELLTALVRRRLSIADELRAQIERVLSEGLTPTHLDTHKHTHLLPPVLDVVCRLSEEYGIRWVRRPFDYPLNAGGVPLSRRVLSRSLHMLRLEFHRKMERHGCRTTDHFAGFAITGRFHTRELLTLLRALPAGTTELMTHPGHCTDELRCLATRLKESREEELAALTAREVRELLDLEQIELTSYRDL